MDKINSAINDHMANCRFYEEDQMDFQNFLLFLNSTLIIIISLTGLNVVYDVSHTFTALWFMSKLKGG